MRIATYNVEWFDVLFDHAGALLTDDAWSRRHNVTRSEQLSALGTVFRALDADVVLVIEAPDDRRNGSTARALENFARANMLRASKALVGFSNETQQEIALLYDPSKVSAAHDPKGAPTGKSGLSGAPRFDGVLRLDLDIDNNEDLISFSKPPLEIALSTPDGNAVQLIGVHLKSKAPYGASTRDEIMKKAITNRRKQQAQAVWLRRRIEQHLKANVPVIVLGDLNDGPGLDEYEHIFGRSSVEIVLGEGAAPNHRLYDPHVQHALQRKIGTQHTTSRFYLSNEKRYMQALLDYILVSKHLTQHTPVWRIWHPFDDPECWNDSELRQALITASDHFPVTLDLEI